MSKRLRTIIISSLSAVALSSCNTTKQATANNGEATKGSDTEHIDPEFLVVTDTQRALAMKNNEFALKLFKATSGHDSEVMSPLSITYLMGMLSNGADGQTRQEILSTMGWKDLTAEEINAFCAMCIRKAADKNAKTTINIANYIAVNKNEKLLSTFSKTMTDYYHAGIESLDFSSQKTVGHINAWCSKQTDGMIPEIIDQVTPDALSYIMNAIFFNGTWKNKFPKELTKPERFQGYTRDIKQVSMMHQEDKFAYLDNDTFSAVYLPYAGDEYAMTVLLPHNDKSVTDMMGTLSAEQLSGLRRDMSNCIVDLKLPRFTTEMETPLNSIISQLGAPSMFEASKADFSLLANGGLHISRMLQKAKIEVSEEGTKAAAITAATVMMTSVNMQQPRHVSFHANRPFVYVITDTETGAILFMGQYTGE